LRSDQPEDGSRNRDRQRDLHVVDVDERGDDEKAQQRGMVKEHNADWPDFNQVSLVEIVLVLVDKWDAEDVAADFKIEKASECQRRAQFDKKVAHRKRRLAVAAATAEQPIADERNVVVP